MNELRRGVDAHLEDGEHPAVVSGRLHGPDAPGGEAFAFRQVLPQITICQRRPCCPDRHQQTRAGDNAVFAVGPKFLALA